MIKRIISGAFAFLASLGVLGFIGGEQTLETALAAGVAALAFLVGEQVGLSTASSAMSASATEWPNPTTPIESQKIPYFQCDLCQEEKCGQPLLTEGGLVCRDCDARGVYTRKMARESRKTN